MAGVVVMRRHGLTDAQRAALEPHLPATAHWCTVYGLFRRWQREGIWAEILAGLQACADAAGKIEWTVSVDSTITRAHQHAAGARRDGHPHKGPPGGGAQRTGRSRAGALARRADHQDPIWLASRAASRRLRHAVECGINLLTGNRGMATRYDKLAVRYEAVVIIAAINQWLNAL